MSTPRRRFAMVFSPKVTANSYGENIVIETGEWRGPVRFEMRGELSMTCARNLILNLRIAMRQIRDEKTKYLNDAVTSAEKPL